MFHENNKLGFYLASREFEDWELKILMDAIAGARFLDSKNTKLILNKLYNLSSKEGSKILKMVSPIFNSNKSSVSLIKIYIDKILSAIKNEKRVSFKYIYYNVDLKLEYKRLFVKYGGGKSSIILRDSKLNKLFKVVEFFYPVR